MPNPRARRDPEFPRTAQRPAGDPKYTAKPMRWKGGLGAAQALPAVGADKGAAGQAAEKVNRRKKQIDDAVDRMSG
jgi:hypothetical protein